ARAPWSGSEALAGPPRCRLWATRVWGSRHLTPAAGNALDLERFRPGGISGRALRARPLTRLRSFQSVGGQQNEIDHTIRPPRGQHELRIAGWMRVPPDKHAGHQSKGRRSVSADGMLASIGVDGTDRIPATPASPATPKPNPRLRPRDPYRCV